MELTIQTFLIVCPLLFLAGLVDAIGGGGGLISLPAYLLAGLPVVAFIVLNKKLFKDNGSEHVDLSFRTYLTAILSAFFIGGYDGLYGPGTGTFLIIAFTVFAKMGLGISNAHAKVINLPTNLTSLIIFILNGQVLFILGITAALCNMAGGYIGAGLAMKKGSDIVKPIILLVLFLLLLKILGIL